MVRTLDIYTDGSADGYWLSFAAVMLFDGQPREVAGRCVGLNSGRAELLAVRLALRKVPQKERKRWAVRIFTDSRMVVHALTKAPPSGLEDLTNQVWLMLWTYARWEVQWIPSRRLPWNERADVLAHRTRKGLAVAP